MNTNSPPSTENQMVCIALTPLPRTCTKDRRTIAQRTPQLPVSVRFRRYADAPVETADVLVGTGGWSQDVPNALSRQIAADADSIVVETVAPA